MGAYRSAGRPRLAVAVAGDRGADSNGNNPSLSRRAFLAGLAATSVAGCATVGLGRPQLTFGPASFEVTSMSALVWLRTSGPARVQVELGRRATLEDAVPAGPFEATAVTDYTVVTELQGLEPDTEYFYRGVMLDPDAAKLTARGGVGRFRTAPVTAKEFQFAWSADMEAGHQPFQLFESVVRRRPDFFLHLGDMIYADVPKDRFVASLGHYRFKHRENRGDRFLQRMLADIPVTAIWDDHEVENDFNSTHDALALGRQAFREYWPVRTGDPRVLHRRFAWTPAAEFFVIDCRSYRSPQSTPEGPAKTMLGAAQKAWLRESLKSSRATFKFIVSSSPFLVSRGTDSWANYTTERRELIEFLRAELIRNVIVLSGDYHLAYDLSGPRGIDEFLAGPIAAWPHCTMRGNEGSRAALERTGRFFICDEFNYGLVVVRPEASPPAVEVQFIDASDRVRHRRTITVS